MQGICGLRATLYSRSRHNGTAWSCQSSSRLWGPRGAQVAASSSCPSTSSRPKTPAALHERALCLCLCSARSLAPRGNSPPPGLQSRRRRCRRLRREAPSTPAATPCRDELLPLSWDWHWHCTEPPDAALQEVAKPLRRSAAVSAPCRLASRDGNTSKLSSGSVPPRIGEQVTPLPNC
jgi:hypothetical protein